MKARNTTSLVVTEDFKPEEKQLAEQIYYSAGLDPVVDDGLHDYDKHIQLENKMINKILGPRDVPPLDDTGYNLTIRGNKWLKRDTHRNKSLISSARQNYSFSREQPSLQ